MTNDESNQQLDRLRSLPLRVSVRVCEQSVTLDRFLAWVPGTILSFDQPVSSPLKMCIGERTLGVGQAVKTGANIGLRLQKISGAADAVKASTNSGQSPESR